MPFSNGSGLNADGRLQVNVVDAAYAPLATDVYINGVLHSAEGYMKTVATPPVGGDVMINGLLHTVLGIRYAQFGVGPNDWPEGFNSDANGIQAMVGAAQSNFIRGIGRDDNGLMGVEIIP